MGEGTHTKSPRKLKGKLTILFGTVALVAVAAIMFQSFNAEDTKADVRKPKTKSTATRTKSSKSSPMALVGNRYITQDDLAKECMARYGQEVLESLINRTIIEEACEAKNIKVTKGEVEAEVLKMAQRFNLDTKAWYNMLKTERGLTPVQYQRDIIWPMIALKKLAGEEVNVTETEIQKAFVRDYGVRVKARMIMLDNSRRAQDVWKLVQKSPKDFSRFATKYSIESNSKALGGSIPPISKYNGSEDLWKEAFKLKIGEISPIIQISEMGQSRYVILQCEGHTQPHATDIAEVRDDLVDMLTEQKTQEKVASVFEEIKKQVKVDNFLTGVQTGGIRAASGKAGTANVRQAKGTGRQTTR